MFDARDWFWLADDGRLYASARQAIVGADDADFVSWRAAHGAPTPWPRDDAGAQTDAALQAVLTPYGLWVDLTAYAADARWRYETGGIVVAGLTVPTDRASQQMIAGMLATVQLDPAATIRFKAGGGFATLDAAQVIAIARAVGAHVQAAFAREADVIEALASQAITTRAQVDAVFAGGAP